MRLESARAELRVRRGGEAIDLGVVLLRALGRPALRAFAGVLLPLMLLTGALAALVDDVAVLLVLWWLKPLFGRAWVLLLGQGLFDEPPGVRALWRDLLQRGRMGLLRDLTLRRPRAASRPLMIAITLLEGASARDAEARRRALASGHAGAMWVALVGCMIVELSIVVGLLAFAWWLLPDEAFWTPGTVFGIDTDTFFMRSGIVAYVLAVGFGEALFVACGFGLYVDGRTRIEGWDVELVFRRMARRLSQLATPLALALLVCGQWLGPSRVARAESPVEPAESVADPLYDEPDAGSDPAAEPWDTDGGSEDSQTEAASVSSLEPQWRRPMPELSPGEAAAGALERTWQRPELASPKTERVWSLKDFDTEAEPAGEPPADLVKLAEMLAKGLRALLWLAVVALAACALYLWLDRLGRARRRDPVDDAEAEAVVHVAGASAQRLSAAEALRRARQLADEDKSAEALASLYVGMLAGLSVRHALDVPPGATEAQCSQLVQHAQAGEEATGLFAEVVRDRLWVTYGRASLSSARLLELMTRYARVFGVAS